MILLALAVFGYVVLFKSRRVRHYYKTLREFDDDYRYVKEEPIIIDENWGTSDAGAPEEGEDYVA